MSAHGFSLPTFESDRANNSFTSRLLLHHFLREEDLEWLRQAPGELSDSQRYALIFLREQGGINNQTLRQLTGADVLTSSQDLRKLRDLKLVTQKGKGSATYYLPGPHFPEETDTPVHGAGLATLAAKHGTLANEHGTLGDQHGTLSTSHGTFRLSPPPEHLAKWKGDYTGMLGPMFFGDTPTFDERMGAAADFEATFNATANGSSDDHAVPV
jgi:ATP-dependent DNA helicase RecG